MKTITGTVTAWLNKHADPTCLNETPERAISALWFYDGDMTSNGWTKVGMATVTIELVDQDELINNKVGSLRAEQKKARADAHMLDVEYERKIQELLAITYEAA